MYLREQSYSLQLVIPSLLAYGTRGEGGRQGNQAVKQEQSTTDKRPQSHYVQTGSEVTRPLRKKQDPGHMTSTETGLQLHLYSFVQPV